MSVSLTFILALWSSLSCLRFIESKTPTQFPTVPRPTFYPTVASPTEEPTSFPTTSTPSGTPTVKPSSQPTIIPTSAAPLVRPTASPTSIPTLYFQPDAAYPEIYLPLVVSAQKKSISVLVNSTNSKVGTLYCAAVSTSYTLSSSSSIKQMGESVLITATSNNGLIPVVLTNLLPATTYDVYCYTEDLFGNEMPLSYALTTKTNVETLCCQGATFTSLNSLIEEYNPAVSSKALPEAWTFAIDDTPKIDTYFSLSIVPAAGSCVYTSPGIAPLAMVTPSIFKFTNSSNSLSRSFIISYSTPGCYIVAITPSNKLFDSQNKTVQIYSSGSENLKAPALSSAAFSEDGRKVSIRFDTPTNMGLGVISEFASIFTCSEAVIFLDSDKANCLWSSSLELIASLDSSSRTGESLDITPIVACIMVS